MIVPVGLALSTKLAQNSRHHTSALYDGLNLLQTFSLSLVLQVNIPRPPSRTWKWPPR